MLLSEWSWVEGCQAVFGLVVVRQGHRPFLVRFYSLTSLIEACRAQQGLRLDACRQHHVRKSFNVGCSQPVHFVTVLLLGGFLANADCVH